MPVFDSLRSRMFVIALVPILGIVIATAELAYEQYLTLEKLHAVEPMIELATVSGDLVHELQKERGGAVGYLSSNGGDAFKDRVTEQRVLTDKALDDYQRTLDAFASDSRFAAILTYLETANAALERLQAHRKKIDVIAVSVPEHLRYYSAIIADLLDLPVIVEEMTPSGELARHLGALRALGWAKENAGLERANGAALFNAEMSPFPAERHKVFISLVGAQAAYLRDFQVFLGPVKSAEWAAVENDPQFAPYRDWQSVLLNLAGTQDTGGVAAAAWFDAATLRINALHAFYHVLAEEAVAKGAAKSGELMREVVIMLGIQVAILVTSLLLCVLVTRATLRPLLAVSSGLSRLAAGETGITFDRNSAGGREVRELNRSAFAFTQAIEDQQRLKDEAEEQRNAADEERRAALMRLAETVEKATHSVVSQVLPLTKGLVESSSGVSRSSVKVSEESEGVAAAAEQSLRNSEAMASATDRLNQSAADIRQQVSEQRQIAHEAQATAAKTRETVDGLNAAATRIEEVVTLIQGIAEQTNLLALNATIEAARAGDAGKGFAVVASEVKSLATQTGKATDDIRQQVEDMVEAMRGAVTAIAQINEVIERMGTISEAVGSAIDEQSSVTTEISQNVHQSTDASREVAQSIARVSGEAQGTRTIAEDNVTSSEQVLGLVESLQHQLSEIIRTSGGGVDRRSEPRVKVPGAKVRLTIGSTQIDGFLVDLSSGGARVKSEEGAEPGQQIGVSIEGRPAIDARVAGTVDGTMRLTFVEPLPADDPLLRRAAA